MNTDGMLRKTVFFLVCAFVFGTSVAHAQSQAFSAHTRVELIPEAKEIQPGDDFWVALRMEMEPQWHVYWVNPGDSGLAPDLKWTLPSSVTAGPLKWPYPQKTDSPPLVSYGYFPETVLFTRMQVDKSAPAGQTLAFALEVKWLVCKEDCVPAQARLTLEIPVAEVSSKNQQFEQLCVPYLAKIPQAEPSLVAQAFLEQAQDLKLYFFFEGQKADVLSAYFFPFSSKILEHTAPQNLSYAKNTYALSLKTSELFSLEQHPDLNGVLVLEHKTDKGKATQAYPIETNIAQEEPALASLGGVETENEGMTIWISLLFAFLGGLILNLMPCVLPVLSINVLGLIQIAGESRQKIWRHGLLFTLGVVAMFWILMALLFIFKAIGYQIGWGFQFQQPLVLVFLCALFFMIAMYLWGAFHIGVGAVNAGGLATQGSSAVQSFWRGALMTVCATPCTAPFMGAALGFALVRPFYEAFWVFSAMGLGMAFPYALLSRYPGLLKYVPKPGLWMERFKFFFGFVLLLPVIYMSDIFAQQNGTPAVIALYYFLLFLGLSVWLFGIFQSAAQKKRSAVRKVFVLLPACVGLWIILGAVLVPQQGVSGSAAAQPSAVHWQKYSQEAFDQALNEEKEVFINFTAAWCMTCKVNDLVAFRNSQVAAALNKDSVIAFKADWTNYDAQVTKALNRYDRNSIPLYVYYPAGKDGARQEPTILPEVITPSMVLDVVAGKQKQ